MNDYMKRALPLLGAAALVSSALMAGTGAVLAGKAAPVATVFPGSDNCQEYPGNQTDYRVAWDMSASKGKWLYAEATLDGVLTDLDDRTVRFAKSDYEQVGATLDGAPRAATMVLQFYDRKGGEFGEPKTFTFNPLTCDR